MADLVEFPLFSGGVGWSSVVRSLVEQWRGYWGNSFMFFFVLSNLCHIPKGIFTVNNLTYKSLC